MPENEEGAKILPFRRGININIGLVIFLFILLYLIYSLIHFAAKNKRPFKRAFISMCTGLAALILINLGSGFTGVKIPVSLLSVLVSVIGGVPGVTLLMFLDLFF